MQKKQTIQHRIERTEMVEKVTVEAESVVKMIKRIDELEGIVHDLANRLRRWGL